MQIAALEAVVSVQEEQLLAATAQEGAAARPEVVTLLPRWRQEALRQYEERLHAQLRTKEAVAACARQCDAARADAAAAHDATAVRCETPLLAAVISVCIQNLCNACVRPGSAGGVRVPWTESPCADCRSRQCSNTQTVHGHCPVQGGGSPGDGRHS